MKFLKYIKIISKENIITELKKLLWPLVAVIIIWLYTIQVIEDSIKDIARISKEIEPKCIIDDFADSSVNLVLKFWINDPHNGIANIKSDIMLIIWEVLNENNIIIPYPQMDLYIKNVSNLES
ncbi:MAG: hypothetical protein ACOCRK_07765 [bacterium]